MTRPLDVLLVGIGGYGNNYVAALLDQPSPATARLVGCVDPVPAGAKRLAELHARGVPVHASLDDFFANATADLAVISTPLHLHAGQTIDLLRRGCHVLCEKPLCVTPADAARMAAAAREADRLVAIGYQWSFSEPIQALKRDLAAGLFGQPRRFRTLVLWPRDQAYYQRSRWAGRQCDDAGAPILDSPANNACAHYLHNMFFLLGATPAVVAAELHRANPIENYDTAALRCTTTSGVELLFITSHAVANRDGPHFSLECEGGVIEYRDGGNLVARFTNGLTRDYGFPNADRMGKLWRTIDDITGHRPTACGVADTAAHTRCVWTAQQSPRGILNFPADSVRLVDADTEPHLVVAGLDAELRDCYTQWKLPSDLGLPWSRPSEPITVIPEPLA
jgi:predicted dehydrogenase